MNFYVNLYQLPEAMRSCSPEADNLIIGDLCRSLEEACAEAAESQFLCGHTWRKKYVCTINDVSATSFISSSMMAVRVGVDVLNEQQIEVPENFQDFMDALKGHQEDHLKKIRRAV